MNVLMVVPDTCTALTSSCFNSSIFFYPPVVSYFGECIVIPPGECEVRLVDWDGWTWDYERDPVVQILPSPGSYVALATLVHHTQPYYIPEQGVSLPITIAETSAVPVLGSTWGRLKARY